MFSKKTKINFFSKKAIFLIIFISFFFSLMKNYQNVRLYDLNLQKINPNVKSSNIIIGSKDAHDYFTSAILIKEGLKEKCYLCKLPIPRASYLYPKLLGIYFFFINEKIINDEGHKILKEKRRTFFDLSKINDTNEKKIKYLNQNKKIYFLIFQSILFYISVFFLFRKLIIVDINPKIIFFIVLLFCIDPLLFNYHSSFFTESIFFSLNITLLSFLIKPKKNFLYLFFIGILCGIIFMQRTIGFFVFIPAILILFIYFRSQYIKISLFVLAGTFFIFGCILLENYKAFRIIKILPQQADDHIAKHFVIPKIITKAYNLNEVEANNFFLKKYKIKQIKSNTQSNKVVLKNLNEDKIKYLKGSFNEIKLNKMIFFKEIFLSRIPAVLALDFNRVQNAYKWEMGLFTKDMFIQNKVIRIFYSIIIYLFYFIGLKEIFKKEKFNIFITSSVIFFIYFFLIVLISTGHNRHFAPVLVYILPVCGFGFYNLYNKIENKFKRKKDEFFKRKL